MDRDKGVSMEPEASSPEQPNSSAPTNVVAAFKRFATNEKLRATERQRLISRHERHVNLHELYKFAGTFKLKTEVPADLVPILSNDVAKQQEIVKQRRKDAGFATSPPADAQKAWPKYISTDGPSLGLWEISQAVTQRPIPPSRAPTAPSGFPSFFDTVTARHAPSSNGSFTMRAPSIQDHIAATFTNASAPRQTYESSHPQYPHLFFFRSGRIVLNTLPHEVRLSRPLRIFGGSEHITSTGLAVGRTLSAPFNNPANGFGFPIHEAHWPEDASFVLPTGRLSLLAPNVVTRYTTHDNHPLHFYLRCSLLDDMAGEGYAFITVHFIGCSHA